MIIYSKSDLYHLCQMDPPKYIESDNNDDYHRIKTITFKNESTTSLPTNSVLTSIISNNKVVSSNPSNGILTDYCINYEGIRENKLYVAWNFIIDCDVNHYYKISSIQIKYFDCEYAARKFYFSIDSSSTPQKKVLINQKGEVILESADDLGNYFIGGMVGKCDVNDEL